MANKKLFTKVPTAAQDAGEPTIHTGAGGVVYGKPRKEKKIKTDLPEVEVDVIPMAVAESKTKAPKTTKAKKEKAPKTTKAKKEKAPKKERGLSMLGAAAKLLGDNDGKPMTCVEMIEAMAKKGLWSSPGGKTPANSLSAAITREIAKGKDSRFARAKKGEKGFTAA